MVFLNEDSIKPGDYFRLPFKPDKAKRMLAQKYGRNPDDFEYDQAGNRYVYKPKRNYGDAKPKSRPKPTPPPTEPTEPKKPEPETPDPTNAPQQDNNGENPPEDNGMMKPTVAWMRENYDRFNQELFGGKLGECDLVLATRGARNLGRFRIRNQVIINRWNRRMYVQGGNYWSGYTQTQIDRSNFATLADPEISMNSSYSATEDALQNTLIHEMCHYYTYMDGYCPKQGHGAEFKQIASIVCSRSNGRFEITRLAGADEMAKHKLDDRVMKRFIDDVYTIFTEMNDGAVRMTRTKNKNLVDTIINIHEKDQRAKRTYVYQDHNMSSDIAKGGKTHLMRTYRFWTMNGDFDTVLSQWPDAQPIKKINYNNMNTENKDRNIVDIITERAITEIKKMDTPTSEFITITPDMDLSEMSPLEMV